MPVKLSLVGTRRLYVKDASGGAEGLVDDDVDAKAREVRFRVW